MRPRRVLIGGLPYFGQMLAGLLTGDNWQCSYLPSPGTNPTAWARAATAVGRADLVYLIGGQIERWSRPDWLVALGRRPVVMHWVGSDVTHALAAARRGLASRRLLSGPTHWAEVAWTAAELTPLGITAEIVRLTSTQILLEPPPLPRDFTVLLYLPDARPEFYGRSAMLRLAGSLPNVQFLVAGTQGRNWEAPPNVEFLGWQREMGSVYARSTVLLRQPQHDGLSFMVLEALTAGRHVIWNHRLEGVIEAADEHAALAHLKRLITLQDEGGLGLNVAGRRQVETEYAPDQIRDEIRGRFEALLGGISP